jgi:hypothetical protein
VIFAYETGMNRAGAAAGSRAGRHVRFED